MKLLLDENLPKKLKLDLTGNSVVTIREQGWTGKSNGDLLKLMQDHQFDALLTFDKNLQYQQNFKKYAVAVIVLRARNNSYNVVRHLAPKIQSLLRSGLPPGATEIKE